MVVCDHAYVDNLDLMLVVIVIIIYVECHLVTIILKHIFSCAPNGLLVNITRRKATHYNFHVVPHTQLFRGTMYWNYFFSHAEFRCFGKLAIM